MTADTLPDPDASQIVLIGTLRPARLPPDDWDGVSELSAPSPFPGWHVNAPETYLSGRPELEAFRVRPTRLVRVYAGDDCENPTMTAALCFPDEATGRAHFPLEDFGPAENEG